MPHFVGLDWAYDDHAVCVVDEQGQIQWRGTVAHSAAGLADLIQPLRRLADPAELPHRDRAPLGPAGRHPRRRRLPRRADPPQRRQGRAAALLRRAGARAIPATRSSSPISCAPTGIASARSAATRRRDPGPARPRSQPRRPRRPARRARQSAPRPARAASGPAPPRSSPTSTRPIALAFLARYPTPQSAARLGESRLASFLARHAYCGRRSAAELLDRLRARPTGLRRRRGVRSQGRTRPRPRRRARRRSSPSSSSSQRRARTRRGPASRRPDRHVASRARRASTPPRSSPSSATTAPASPPPTSSPPKPASPPSPTSPASTAASSSAGPATSACARRSLLRRQLATRLALGRRRLRPRARARLRSPARHSHPRPRLAARPVALLAGPQALRRHAPSSRELASGRLRWRGWTQDVSPAHLGGWAGRAGGADGPDRAVRRSARGRGGCYRRRGDPRDLGPAPGARHRLDLSRSGLALDDRREDAASGRRAARPGLDAKRVRTGPLIAAPADDQSSRT